MGFFTGMICVISISSDWNHVSCGCSTQNVHSFARKAYTRYSRINLNRVCYVIRSTFIYVGHQQSSPFTLLSQSHTHTHTTYYTHGIVNTVINTDVLRPFIDIVVCFATKSATDLCAQLKPRNITTYIQHCH